MLSKWRQPPSIKPQWFSTFKKMLILNESKSKVYSEHHWIEAQIIKTMGCKNHFQRFRKKSYVNHYFLYYIFNIIKRTWPTILPAIKFACASKHIPIYYTTNSQRMTCTAGQKVLGSPTKTMHLRCYIHYEQGPEDEVFKRHSLLWKSLQKVELLYC